MNSNYKIKKISKKFPADKLKDFFDRSQPGKTLDQCKKIIEKSSIVGAFIEDKLVVIGRALDDGVYAMITDINTDPNYRHHGIGTTITKKLINLLDKKDIKVIHCGTDKHLIEFYKNCGFTYDPEEATLYRFNL